MKWQFLDSTESTSTSLSLLVKESELSEPLGLFARTQTKGRGQRSKAWCSEHPSLTASFAFSVPRGQNPGFIPHWVATTTATYLRDTFGFHATIKWPNDLLFAGQKFAGILCEMVHDNNACPAVIVGIGINLSSATIGTDLREILDFEPDPRQLALGLGQRLEQDWPMLELFSLSSYEAMAVPTGELLSESGEPFYLEGYQEDGSLQVRDRSGNRTNVASASRSFSWWASHASTLWVADAGNTSLKLASYHIDSGRLTADRIHRFPYSDRQGVQDLIQNEGIRNVKLGSVTGQLPDLWPESLNVTMVAKRLIRLGRTDYELSQLGADRLATIEGVLSLKPTLPFMVISAGTACTIDLVVADREGHSHHLGGYIVPGLGLTGSVLAEAAHLLPLIDPPSDCDLSLGTETASAIARGSLVQLVGLILMLYQRDLANSGTIYFTGGDGAKLCDALAGVGLASRYEPHLTTLGFAAQSLGGLLAVRL